MADQAAPQDYGNETLAEFCARPEWAAAYGNPDGDDTFATLNACTNAVWARAVRDSLKQINEAFACRHVTPLSTAAKAASIGKDWRPSDDDAYAIAGTDFAAASVLVPDYFFTFNATNLCLMGSGTTIEQDLQTGDRVYSYVRVQGRPGGSIGSSVIGMRTFLGAVGVNDTYDSSLALSTALAASITVRIPEWPQANERIVLLAIRNKDIDDETGATNRMNFEFGLGPDDGGDSPGNLDSAYSLYCRWIDSLDAESFAENEILDENGARRGLGITPGYEWTLGFHRYEEPVASGIWMLDFYVNGQLVHTAVDNSSPAPGSATGIRLHVGAGRIGKQFCGGPVRNVMVKLGQHDPSAISPLMEFLYQKGAGYI